MASSFSESSSNISCKVRRVAHLRQRCHRAGRDPSCHPAGRSPVGTRCPCAVTGVALNPAQRRNCGTRTRRGLARMDADCSMSGDRAVTAPEPELAGIRAGIFWGCEGQLRRTEAVPHTPKSLPPFCPPLSWRSLGARCSPRQSAVLRVSSAFRSLIRRSSRSAIQENLERRRPRVRDTRSRHSLRSCGMTPGRFSCELTPGFRSCGMIPGFCSLPSPVIASAAPALPARSARVLLSDQSTPQHYFTGLWPSPSARKRS